MSASSPQPNLLDGQPSNADYGATATPTANAQAPPKPPSVSRIEPKVWLANERTWLNWCRTGILLGSFGVVLVNCSPSIGARVMGFTYSIIAIGIIAYGNFLYKKRITLIKQKYPGHFDEVIAPLIIALSLFVAILVNFIFRAIDSERHKSPMDSPKTPWVAAPASAKFS